MCDVKPKKYVDVMMFSDLRFPYFLLKKKKKTKIQQ